MYFFEEISVEIDLETLLNYMQQWVKFPAHMSRPSLS